jgi:cytoskeletal protein RodZ
MSDTNNELTAGQMLRLARTTGRRKRELNTVARLLCIKEDFLEALESDDFGRIPELVYILGFARNYAMELELDPYMIVEKIKKQMGIVEEIDEADIEEGPGMAAAPQRVSAIGNFLRKNSKNILIGFISLVMAGAAALIVLNLSGGEPETEAAETITAEKYNMPVAREYGLRNKDYASVVLQSTGKTWIQIKNPAGSVIFEHSMTEGDVYYALNGTTATIGNAGALDIWVNGREIPKLGAEGKRMPDVLLTPESLAK